MTAWKAAASDEPRRDFVLLLAHMHEGTRTPTLGAVLATIQASLCGNGSDSEILSL
ncbi:hypothetical protein QTI33_04275 [Variovorax sp. J22P271]|nr:hypothetical protein [Variovorax sp. J22P271]